MRKIIIQHVIPILRSSSAWSVDFEVVVHALDAQSAEGRVDGSADVVIATSHIRSEVGVHSALIIGVVAAPVRDRAAAPVDVVKEPGTALVVGEVRRVGDNHVPLVD